MQASLPLVDSRSALFLDVDGTLLDITATVQDSVVPADLQATLVTLRELMNGALALVSGRPIAQFDELFAPFRFAGGGQHGAELRLQHGGPVVRTSNVAVGEALRREIATIAREHAEVLLEDKGASITVHYRRAPTLAVPLARQLRMAIARSGDGLILAAGRMVWEIRNATCSKATAVRALMQQPAFAGRRPIYVGDDYSDEEGFAEAERFGGVALAVAGESVIDRAAAFADPAAVRAWLRVAADQLQSAA